MLPKEFIELTEKGFHNNNEANEKHPVVIKYAPTDLDKKDHWEFHMKIEEGVKIEFDNFEAECKETYKGYFADTSKMNNLKSNAVGLGNDSGCTKSVQTSSDMDFKVKLEYDGHQEECKESFQEHFIEPDQKDSDGEDRKTASAMEDVDFKVEIEENIKTEYDNCQGEFQGTSHELDENEEALEMNGINASKKKHKKIRKVPKKRKIRCDACQYSTNDLSNLKIHQRIHASGLTFVCTMCQKGHNEASKLNRHMFSHLKEAINIRELDPVKIYDKLGIKSRITAELAGKQYIWQTYKCVQCTYINLNSSAFYKHIRAKHKNDADFKCEFCVFSTALESDLEMHIEQRHTFFCPLCNCKFDKKNELNTHIEICKFATPLNGILHTHVSSVDLKERKFECHLCKYKANKKSHLTTHISSVHLDERKFECDLCPYKANQNSILSKHMSSVHLKERKFECQLCEYKANRNSILNKHVSTVHLKERYFECHVCEYKASHKSSLNKHMSSVHLKERKYDCNFCSYRTNEKWILNKHMSSVHLNERKFECHFCAYKANQKSHLDTHISSVHLNERKFECQFCDYKANQKSHLDTHMSFVHSHELHFNS